MPIPQMHPAAWNIARGALHASLEVLDMDDDGAIQIPQNITHIVIEVGANGRNWLWNEPVPAHVPGIKPNVPVSDQPGILLLAFEPLLEHYAKYLSMLTHADSLWPGPPGWSARGRAIVLPFAIAPDDAAGAESGQRGLGTLHVSNVDGCSSLLPIDGNETAGAWKGTFLMRHCGAAASRPRRVPVVSLREVVGGWLRDREVSFVKVDAQGFDLRVAQSAGASVRRIRSFKLEVTSDDCRLPVRGAHSCTPTVEGMRELGFAAVSPASCTASSGQGARWRNRGCAADFLFERS